MIRVKSILVSLALAAWSIPSFASTTTPPPEHDWSFNGVFGTFDRASLQRGFQVYREVCSSCHGLGLLSYRNLEQIGLTPEQVRAVAAEHDVQDGPNDEGDMFTRPARASDRFVSPFPNEQAARAANNGAYPPDLSLIIKARPGGPDYVRALLTGYQDPAPHDFHLMDGMYYNDFFPGHQIGMPPPLTDGRVDYADGTPATVPQMANDVVTYLTWASEPTMEERKQLGMKVLLFLIVLVGLLYALKRQVWSDAH